MALDRLHSMEVFVKVVELGHFAHAAERLDMSTSAVSRAIAELEAHLDTRLLNRTTRRISLTESGRAYHERALQLLSDVEEAEAMVSGVASEPKGTIRLTCSVHFGVKYLAPAIGLFQAAHPDVHFDLTVSERFVDLVEEGIDLAVRIGDLGNSNLVARKIGQMQLVTAASKKYLSRHGVPKHPNELASHNCLSYEYASIKHVWPFRDGDGGDLRVRIEGSARANNGEMLVAIAAEGVGIVQEPDFVVNAFVSAGKLRPILKAFQPAPHPIYAVYPSRRHLSAKVRAFVDFLAQYFAECPRWG